MRLSRALSLCLSYKRKSNFANIYKYLSNAHAPTSDGGTIVTGDPTMWVGSMVGQARFGTAGKLFEFRSSSSQIICVSLSLTGRQGASSGNAPFPPSRAFSALLNCPPSVDTETRGVSLVLTRLAGPEFVPPRDL